MILEINMINKLFKKFDSPKMVVNKWSKLGIANHLKTPETKNIQAKKPNKRTINLFFSIFSTSLFVYLFVEKNEFPFFHKRFFTPTLMFI